MLELKEIGRNIALLRHTQGMTQEQVAFRSGLSISRLQDIEHGCNNTTVDTLIRIAWVLKVNSRVLAIFSRSDDEILSAICRSPRLPEQPGGVLQICRNITLLRKKEGLTQQQLACMANMSVSRLRDIEHGCANTTVYKLARIAEGFGLSVLELSVLTTSDHTLFSMIRAARDRAGLDM